MQKALLSQKGVVFLILLSLPCVSFCTEPATSSNAPPEEMPRLVPWVDYSGGFFSRPALTGNWGGVRQHLMDKGLRFDSSLTQTLQRNLAGGMAYDGSYTGNMRYGLELDTGKMGLWPGGLLTIRGMSRYGHSNNPNTGAFLPVNTESMFPVPGEDISCLTDLYLIQFLSPQIALMAGKTCPREANVFAGDETTQFSNAAFVFDPVIATTIPLSFETVGVILLPVDWVKLTTLVLDSEGSANHCGFPEAFQRGTTVYQNLEVTVKPWDLNGHQRVSWTWSDKTRIPFEQTDRTLIKNILTGESSSLERKSSDWSFYYDFDQYVYTLPDKKNQGIGLFGRFGVTSGEVNPTEAFYSLGVGGKGMIPGRDSDTFGAGYYYLALSDELRDAVGRFPERFSADPEDEQGVELYYNIAVTPWLHVTPDLQIIDPVRGRVDTTLVAGLRVKMDF